MKKIKYRFYLDYEKEEDWINDMAKSGWHLMKFAFARYTFKKGEPGTFVYRNECIIGMTSSEKNEYFELLKESGVTIIHEFGGWVYMKKAVADGPFQLYTDTKSQMAYYTRILKIFSLFFLVNVFWGILILSNTSKIESGVGILNILVAVLIVIPLIKVMQRKKNLRDKNRLFE